jgi:hypothetical protein
MAISNGVWPLNFSVASLILRGIAPASKDTDRAVRSWGACARGAKAKKKSDVPTYLPFLRLF